MSAEVELLRRAAALMRERALAATPGPWEFRTQYPHIVWQPVGDEDHVLSTNLSLRPAEDARHIGSFAVPAVALAVADWLDATANDPEFDPYCCGEGEVCFACETQKSALSVARAYLREAS